MESTRVEYKISFISIFCILGQIDFYTNLNLEHCVCVLGPFIYIFPLFRKETGMKRDSE